MNFDYRVSICLCYFITNTIKLIHKVNNFLTGGQVYDYEIAYFNKNSFATMKIATTVVRILLGALFVFSAATVLFQIGPPPAPPGKMGLFFEGILASGYLLILIKVTELVCGLAFIVGRYVPLATVVIFPVSVNILLTHIFLAPEGLPIALFVLFANLFLAYRNWSYYEPMLVAK